MAKPKKVIPFESVTQPWQPVPTPSRFRNALSKYRVWRDEGKCVKCGNCVEVCPYGVHTKAGNYLRRPKSYRCLGTACQNNDFYCVKQCPVQALRVSIHPVYSTLGDSRWTPDLLLSNWWQAETGELPYIDLDYRLGDFRRRLRQAALPVSQGPARLPVEPRRHLPGGGNQPPGGRPAPDQAVGPLVRRRHVLRLGLHQHHHLPGPGRHPLQHHGEHRGRRLS